MKVETVPLLSPTMETELFKEPWVFPRAKANPTKGEDVALSAWEEHFQDLSSWCMDTFQGQCDFPIGESTTFELSGTKYEGNGVSIAEEEGLLKDLTRTADDEKLNLKMDIVKTTRASSDNRHSLLSPLEFVNEYGLKYKNEENSAASNTWLTSLESAATKSTTSSSKQHDADVGTPQSKDRDFAGPTSLGTAATNQRETWDELRTIETTGSDAFDLLSYLWEDEMRSIEGSVPTDDSSAVLKVRPMVAAMPSPSVLSFASAKVKTELEIDEPTTTLPPSTRRRAETRATSTVTAASTRAAKSLVASPPRRSERTRVAASKDRQKKESAVASTKAKVRSGRKRYYESEEEEEEEENSEEEEEEDVVLSQYRECREKNNEASRRSRMNKKAKESEMVRRATELERDNKILKMKVEELEKLVTSMRNTLLQSALKKEF